MLKERLRGKRIRFTDVERVLLASEGESSGPQGAVPTRHYRVLSKKSDEVCQGLASLPPRNPNVLRHNRSANAERQAKVAAAMGHTTEDEAGVISVFCRRPGIAVQLAGMGVPRAFIREVAEYVMHDEWLQ